MILISEKETFFDPRKPFQSARPETHEEWQARMGGEVLAVVRSGLYLDFRFLDQALSALTPTADERCGVLATDGTILCYQPSALLRLYQKNPKYLNRLYLHTVFHCIFRHLWLRGKRDKRLWDLACDIAVENVIDGLGRKSVQRPLTWVRQHAYEEIIAQEKVAAAAPIYRWLVRQTPGVLRQLEKEFYTDDHRHKLTDQRRGNPRDRPSDYCPANDDDEEVGDVEREIMRAVIGGRDKRTLPESPNSGPWRAKTPRDTDEPG